MPTTFVQRAALIGSLALLALFAACGRSIYVSGVGAGSSTDQTATATASGANHGGTTGTTTTGGLPATPTPGRAPYTPTPRPTPDYPLTGCPLATQTFAWPDTPAVIITKVGPTTVKVGQTFEIALAFGHRYFLASTQFGPAVALDSPAGYGDQATKQCIWHFHATQAGSANIVFAIDPLCPTETCPGYAVNVTFTINVTN